MCPCTGGRRSVTIKFEMGPSGALPLTQENLKLVTSIGVNTRLNTLALIINHTPDEGGPKKYEVIDLHLEKPGDLPDVGSGGIKLARMILEALCGHPFIELNPFGEDSDMKLYVRKDFKEKIDELEADTKE